MVGERGAPQFYVVFRRDTDFGVNLETILALAKLGTRLREYGFVAFGGAQGGLVSGRPKFSRRHVAQINKGSPAIARGVFAPAGHRQIAPATVTATCVADCDMIATVGQEVHLRRPRRGSREHPHDSFGLRETRPG